MSTKYGSQQSATWKWRYVDDNPRIADHVLFERDGEPARWDRTPPDSCSPEHAYLNGVDVTFMADSFRDRGGQTPDEAVYWSEETESGRYDIVFIVKDETIRTIYRVDSIRDEVVRNALYGLRKVVDSV